MWLKLYFMWNHKFQSTVLAKKLSSRGFLPIPMRCCRSQHLPEKQLWNKHFKYSYLLQVEQICRFFSIHRIITDTTDNTLTINFIYQNYLLFQIFGICRLLSRSLSYNIAYIIMVWYIISIDSIAQWII